VAIRALCQSEAEPAADFEESSPSISFSPFLMGEHVYT
jgi:hypothetical protein